MGAGKLSSLFIVTGQASKRSLTHMVDMFDVLLRVQSSSKHERGGDFVYMCCCCCCGGREGPEP